MQDVVRNAKLKTNTTFMKCNSHFKCVLFAWFLIA